MNIRKIDNQEYTPCFGIRLGTKMQERIMLAKKRDVFSDEQLANLKKIEDNGINAILELSDKFVISSVNNKKGILKIKKILCLTDEINKVDITDMSFAYEPTTKSNRFIFHTHKFLRIFNNDFNLPQKIEQAWTKLSKGSC